MTAKDDVLRWHDAKIKDIISELRKNDETIGVRGTDKWFALIVQGEPKTVAEVYKAVRLFLDEVTRHGGKRTKDEVYLDVKEQ